MSTNRIQVLADTPTRKVQAASVSLNLNVVAVRLRLIVVQRHPSGITYAAAAAVLLSHFTSRVAARFPPLHGSLSASRQPFKTPTVAFVSGHRQRQTPIVTGCNFRQTSSTGERTETAQVFLEICRPGVTLSLSLSLSLCFLPAPLPSAFLNFSFHHPRWVQIKKKKKKKVTAKNKHCSQTYISWFSLNEAVEVCLALGFNLYIN